MPAEKCDVVVCARQAVWRVRIMRSGTPIDAVLCGEHAFEAYSVCGQGRFDRIPPGKDN